jgi:hypothetical protein
MPLLGDPVLIGALATRGSETLQDKCFAAWDLAALPAVSTETVVDPMAFALEQPCLTHIGITAGRCHHAFSAVPASVQQGFKDQIRLAHLAAFAKDYIVYPMANCQPGGAFVYFTTSISGRKHRRKHHTPRVRAFATLPLAVEK